MDRNAAARAAAVLEMACGAHLGLRIRIPLMRLPRHMTSAARGFAFCRAIPKMPNAERLARIGGLRGTPAHLLTHGTGQQMCCLMLHGALGPHGPYGPQGLGVNRLTR